MRTATNHRLVEDPFAATRMPLGDHLEDLRRHIGRALAGFAAVLVLIFLLDFLGYVTDTPIGPGKAVQNLIARPVERQLEAFYDNRVQKVLARLEQDAELQRANQPGEFVPVGIPREQLLALVQGRPAAEVNRFPRPVPAAGEDADVVKLWLRQEEPLRDAALRQRVERQVGRRPTLRTLGPAEGMMVYVKVAMACGVVLASPWIFWQLWSFVAVGLYPHERRPVHVYLPFSLGLFLAGLLFCQFLVLPKAIEALLWFNDWLDYEPDLRLTEWLGFALLLPLVFGLSFQTPLVMVCVNRLGLLDGDAFRRHRRLAWFLLAVLAAVITPTVDAVNLLLLWVPLCGLYELGLFLCRLSPRPALE
jgi:sec-independent protein translocase protein TatC